MGLVASGRRRERLNKTPAEAHVADPAVVRPGRAAPVALERAHDALVLPPLLIHGASRVPRAWRAEAAGERGR